MAKELSITEAKTNFSAAIREAESGELVVITRHGKPAAALIDAEALEWLRRLRAAGPDRGLAGVAGGWEGSEELADLIERSERSGSRSVPALD